MSNDNEYKFSLFWFLVFNVWYLAWYLYWKEDAAEKLKRSAT